MSSKSRDVVFCTHHLSLASLWHMGDTQSQARWHPMYAGGVKSGILADPRSLAFYFSTDGVCLLRKCRQHTVHLLLLINYNLHPELRFQGEHIIRLRIVLGPKKPKDLLFFLYPMVDEFKVCF